MFSLTVLVFAVVISVNHVLMGGRLAIDVLLLWPIAAFIVFIVAGIIDLTVIFLFRKFIESLKSSFK